MIQDELKKTSTPALPRLNYPGSYFISFEGMEGAGKSTQIPLFKEFIEKNFPLKVSVFREPGGTEWGEKLRQIMLEQKKPVHPISEIYLFASSRAQLLSEKVLPLLQQSGNMVIMDRFIDSSLVYQGIARKLGIDTVLSIHQYPPLNIFPDLTWFLDLPLEISLQRMKNRKNLDYFESSDEEFFKDLNSGFKSLLTRFKERILPIDGNQSEQEVACSIQEKWVEWNSKFKKFN
jgi:dTMP kinase